MQRDSTGLHGDPSELLILSAVQVPQLEDEDTRHAYIGTTATIYTTFLENICLLTFPARRLDMIPLLATRQSARVVLPAEHKSG